MPLLLQFSNAMEYVDYGSFRPCARFLVVWWNPLKHCYIVPW
jgi:hypothetical protein